MLPRLLRCQRATPESPSRNEQTRVSPVGRGRQLAEVQARLDAIAAKTARLAQDTQDIAQVRQVADAFQAEMKKPVGEQQFEPLTTTLDKLVATFDEKSAGRGEVEVLKKRIETQRWLAEAMAIQASKPPAVEEPPPPRVDPLESMQAIGWLRYERRLGGPGLYYVEKGGQRQDALTCNSGRYDLALFVGHEVGLNGPRRAPGGDTIGGTGRRASRGARQQSALKQPQGSPTARAIPSRAVTRDRMGGAVARSDRAWLLPWRCRRRSSSSRRLASSLLASSKRSSSRVRSLASLRSSCSRFWPPRRSCGRTARALPVRTSTSIRLSQQGQENLKK